MTQNLMTLGRRTLLKAGFAAGAAGSLVYPATGWGKSEKPVKIGMIDAKTGTYAAEGLNEIRGAKMAVDQINAKGGILGRPVHLLAEDDQTLPGPAVSKARMLLDKDNANFLMGSVSSAVSQSLSGVAQKRGVLFIDTGGHSDSVTGSNCAWTTFRTCSTTWELTAGNFGYVSKKFGKRWFFITPDYAFGHSLHGDYLTHLKKAGGVQLGNALSPLGTTDFSSYLIRARAANPDVLMLLVEGNDLINCLKQLVQFGLDKKMAVAGALMEFEDEEALPKETLLGWWNYEWYWKQPNVPEVAKFVEEYKKRPDSQGKVPTARVWFGFASAHAIALAANQAKSLDTMKVVKSLEGLQLPPEIALQPGKVHYRPGDHQLMANEFPGHIPHDASYPNLFEVAKTVPSESIAKSPAASGCKMTYPS